MELTSCINFLLSTSQHTVFQYLSEELSVHGVTPAQYGVLNCLWRDQQLTPKQIGEQLYLEASSVSSILDRMQKSALIERNIDPDNRRTVIVSATQKAKDLQVPIEKIITKVNDRVQELFSREEYAVLENCLQTIIQRKLRG